MAGASTPPGWYAAEGDPPGTQRWWDGNQWVGEPQPIPSSPTPDPSSTGLPLLPEATPPSVPEMNEPSSSMPLLPGSGAPQDGMPTAGGFPGAPMPAPAGAMPNMYAEGSKATLALVLSIVGFFLCGVLSVVGLILGWQERSAIDAGRRDPANRGQAVAAIVIGGIITALMVLAFIAIIALVALGSAA